MPLPKKVTLGDTALTIEWSDGHRSIHSNKELREACPCAMCAGEPPAIGVSSVIPLMVAAPEGIFAQKYSMVGRYAISFVWSDGHSTGIYPYEYLRAMCECGVCAAARESAQVARGGLISE